LVCSWGADDDVVNQVFIYITGGVHGRSARISCLGAEDRESITAGGEVLPGHTGQRSGRSEQQERCAGLGLPVERCSWCPKQQVGVAVSIKVSRGAHERVFRIRQNRVFLETEKNV
jgi:hypothetical protein